jgi:acyl-CoA reductase-like NAD-dependent aldehyde dehydrogenase
MEATSPGSGESIGTVPQGTRADARRAIEAANVAAPGWAARSAFERAHAMERVAELIVERRDDLAYALALDQGKPLHAEAYGEVDELVEYWKMAAADATRLEGSMPPSVDATKERARLPRAARRGRRAHALELALHHSRRAPCAPRSLRATRSSGWVNVNESTNYWESHLPFGGRAGTGSGVGRVGGRHAMETFTEPKTVVISLG